MRLLKLLGLAAAASLLSSSLALLLADSGKNTQAAPTLQVVVAPKDNTGTKSPTAGYSDFDTKELFVIDHGTNTVYLTTYIGPASEYIELAKYLATLSETDQVTFNMNCPGGNVDGMGLILEAMKATKASTKALVSGTAASACAFLAIQADELEVGDLGGLMFHDFQFGVSPNTASLTVFRAIAYMDMGQEQIRALTKGFLTEEELEQLFKGKEIWMAAKETRERAKKAGIKVVDETSRATKAPQSN